MAGHESNAPIGKQNKLTFSKNKKVASAANLGTQATALFDKELVVEDNAPGGELRI